MFGYVEGAILVIVKTVCVLKCIAMEWSANPIVKLQYVTPVLIIDYPPLDGVKDFYVVGLYYLHSCIVQIK